MIVTSITSCLLFVCVDYSTHIRIFLSFPYLYNDTLYLSISFYIDKGNPGTIFAPKCPNRCYPGCFHEQKKLVFARTFTVRDSFLAKIQILFFIPCPSFCSFSACFPCIFRNLPAGASDSAILVRSHNSFYAILCLLKNSFFGIFLPF